MQSQGKNASAQMWAIEGVLCKYLEADLAMPYLVTHEKPSPGAHRLFDQRCSCIMNDSRTKPGPIPRGRWLWLGVPRPLYNPSGDWPGGPSPPVVRIADDESRMAGATAVRPPETLPSVRRPKAEVTLGPDRHLGATT